MSDEYEFDLGWHSLNYRTAGINEAQACWLELEEYVNRLVEREVNAANAEPCCGDFEACSRRCSPRADYFKAGRDVAQRHCSCAILDYNNEKEARERVEAKLESYQHTRLQLNDNGSLDEIVASPGHLEQLDRNHWFVCLGDYAVWLHAKGKITASYENRAEFDAASKANG